MQRTRQRHAAARAKLARSTLLFVVGYFSEAVHPLTTLTTQSLHLKNRRRRDVHNATRVPFGVMIPVRVSHNQSIGPGVVPAGVDPAYDAQYANHKGPVAHVGANGFGRPFSVAPGPITHTQYVRHPPLTPDWSRPKTVTVFTSCSNPKRKRLGVRAMQHHDLQRVEGRAKAVYAWKAKNSTSSPLRFEICAQSTSSFSLTSSPPPPSRDP